MPHSLVNEVDDRSIDGRKDWAIPSSTGIDKPRIDPNGNGHLSRRDRRFRPESGSIASTVVLADGPAVM
jgi:hypothetical protein